MRAFLEKCFTYYGTDQEVLFIYVWLDIHVYISFVFLSVILCSDCVDFDQIIMSYLANPNLRACLTESIKSLVLP